MKLRLILLFTFLLGWTTHSMGANSTPVENESILIKKWLEHPNFPFLDINSIPLDPNHVDDNAIMKNKGVFGLSSKKDKNDNNHPKVVNLLTRATKKGVYACSFENMRGENVAVDVHIRYRTGNCQLAQLVMYRFRQNTELISSDTLTLPSAENWTNVSRKFLTKGCDLFTLSLEVQGSSKKKPGVLSIENFTYTANGLPLPSTINQPVCPIKDSDIQTWQDLLSSPLMDKKILALGEAIHGTDGLPSLIFSLMKERVMHHQTRCILLEMPTELILPLNRYVKNDQRFYQAYQDVAKRINGMLLTDSLLHFFEWVKDYNAAHNNEISIFGVDQSLTRMDSQIDLYKFLNTLGKKEEVSTLCQALKQSNPNTKHILQLLDANNYLKKELTDTELLLLRQCISTWDITKSYFRLSTRDSYMAATTKKLVAQLASHPATITMYLHLLHVAYHRMNAKNKSFIIFPDYPSMGELLRKDLGENYATLGFTCLQGETVDVSRDSVKVLKLREAMESSIEYQMGKKATPTAYLPTRVLSPDCTYHIRYVGNKLIENQFVRINPREWMDGVVVVNEAKACKKDKTLLPKAQFQQMLQRIADVHQKPSKSKQRSRKGR